jgi:hypothetical protein
MGERTRYAPGTFCWVGARRHPTPLVRRRSMRACSAGRLRTCRPARQAPSRRYATAERTSQSFTGRRQRRERPARHRTGPPTSRSRTPTRPRPERTSSAAPRSSASPSTCWTPAARPRYEIRRGRSCHSGSRVRESALRSSTTSAPGVGTNSRPPSSSGPSRSSPNCSAGSTRPTTMVVTRRS